MQVVIPRVLRGSIPRVAASSNESGRLGDSSRPSLTRAIGKGGIRSGRERVLTRETDLAQKIESLLLVRRGIKPGGGFLEFKTIQGWLQGLFLPVFFLLFDFFDLLDRGNFNIILSPQSSCKKI
jgi:hypothetical protein